MKKIFKGIGIYSVVAFVALVAIVVFADSLLVNLISIISYPITWFWGLIF